MLNRSLLWLSSRPLIARFVPALFVPAGVGLLRQTIHHQTNSTTDPELLVTIALLLFCIELAWMAYVDLNNVALISARKTTPTLAQSHSLTEALPTALPDAKLAKTAAAKAPPSKTRTAEAQRQEIDQLNRFFLTTISTIVLEATGFYTALLSPPVGALIIICSQIWFNLLAGIQLFPQQEASIITFGASQRIEVLGANALAVLLLCLWPMATMRTLAAVGLLALIILFLLIKYMPSIYDRLKSSQ